MNCPCGQLSVIEIITSGYMTWFRWLTRKWQLATRTIVHCMRPMPRWPRGLNIPGVARPSSGGNLPLPRPPFDTCSVVYSQSLEAKLKKVLTLTDNVWWIGWWENQSAAQVTGVCFQLRFLGKILHLFMWPIVFEQIKMNILLVDVSFIGL